MYSVLGTGKLFQTKVSTRLVLSAERQAHGPLVIIHVKS
jgi:hypothetical protein